MPICEKHGTYLKGDEVCGYCWRETSSIKKASSKQTNGSTTNKVLRDRVQRNFSKLIKKIHCGENQFTECWTCGKRIYVKGSSVITTAHCGHYFPKGIYWELACDIHNAGIQCYQCNIWNQGVIPAMRTKLVQIWGEENIKDLEKRAESFLLRVKTGQIKSRPDDLWLMAMARKLKEDLNNASQNINKFKKLNTL